MRPTTRTARAVRHRARTATPTRPFENPARRLAALDYGLLASVVLAVLLAAYVAAVVPAETTRLFGGFALAVAAAAALPFAVVRAVASALTRVE